MILPFMSSQNKTQRTDIQSFGGVNPTYSRRTNELVSARNMSSHLYPALSSGARLASQSAPGLNINAGEISDRLYLILYPKNTESGNMYIYTSGGSDSFAEFNSLTEAQIERKIVFMGNKLFILPDNVVYDPEQRTVERCNITQSITHEWDNEKYRRESLTSDEQCPNYLTRWFTATLSSNSIDSVSANYSISGTKYKFYHMAADSSFKVGDYVHVSMTVVPNNATQDSAYFAYQSKMSRGSIMRIRSFTTATHDTPSGKITERTGIVFDDNAVDTGGYSEVFVQGITITKASPDFVDACSHENRIWGVTKDTICASKLGDMCEWNDFSVDSYGSLPSSCFKTGVPSGGDFTAITQYNGRVIAFKEKCMHIVYGSQPSDYRISTVQCDGVRSGAAGSIEVIDGIMYYVGVGGVYVYSGGIPKLISRGLGIEKYDIKDCGSDGRCYYILAESENENVIYVYDTYAKVWHIHDSPSDLRHFASDSTKMLLLCKNAIYSYDTDTVVSPGNWNFEYSFWTKEFESRHVCGVDVMFSLETGGKLDIYLENIHGKKKLAHIDGKKTDEPTYLALPVSCDHKAKLIFSGSGKFTLSSLSVKFIVN